MFSCDFCGKIIDDGCLEGAAGLQCTPPPSVSDQLRMAITQSAFSRYEIAAGTGVHQSTLSRFVSGNRTISMNAIDSVCSFLGLSLDVGSHDVIRSDDRFCGEVCRSREVDRRREIRDTEIKEIECLKVSKRALGALRRLEKTPNLDALESPKQELKQALNSRRL